MSLMEKYKDVLSSISPSSSGAPPHIRLMPTHTSWPAATLLAQQDAPSVSLPPPTPSPAVQVHPPVVKPAVLKNKLVLVGSALACAFLVVCFLMLSKRPAGAPVKSETYDAERQRSELFEEEADSTLVDVADVEDVEEESPELPRIVELPVETVDPYFQRL